jgi:hypothetical protein
MKHPICFGSYERGAACIAIVDALPGFASSRYQACAGDDHVGRWSELASDQPKSAVLARLYQSVAAPAPLFLLISLLINLKASRSMSSAIISQHTRPKEVQQFHSERPTVLHPLYTHLFLLA